ncbi:MAG: hypothetical protein AB7O88_07005 [Reyranellaceae bacterium]
MSVPDTASDGMPARALYLTMTVPPRRRRTLGERLRRAVRSHVGMAVFVAMLVASAGLVLFSR